jgi:hypothetical protein
VRKHSAYTSFYIIIEDNSNQQWSWTMVVGKTLALYGYCSIYN